MPVVAEAENVQRGKREPQLHQDVEFISDRARSLVLEGKAQKHGGNYRKAKDYRGKRDHEKTFAESLSFDPKEGIVVDERSGNRYELKPIDF